MMISSRTKIKQINLPNSDLVTILPHLMMMKAEGREVSMETGLKAADLKMFRGLVLDHQLPEAVKVLAIAEEEIEEGAEETPRTLSRAATSTRTTRVLAKVKATTTCRMKTRMTMTQEMEDAGDITDTEAAEIELVEMTEIADMAEEVIKVNHPQLELKCLL